LLEGGRGENVFQFLRRLARLRRVRLVDNQSEPGSGQLTNCRGNHRKLLQGGDDDGLAGFEGLLQLLAALIDVLHHAKRLLELTDGALQLPIEHFSIRDHDDRVEDTLVVVVH
jgi:hypothetical protein